MLMLLAILLPMAAGALLPLWRPGASRARRGYVMASSCAAAALGLMGVPPLTGFTSKWMLATAAAGLGTWMGYLGASVLILSAVLTALYLMQIVLLAFFPRQNRQLSVRVPKRARRDPGLRMTVPITALAAGSVALGLGAGRLAGTVAALLG